MDPKTDQEKELEAAAKNLDLEKFKALIQKGITPKNDPQGILSRALLAKRYWSAALILRGQDALRHYEETRQIRDELLPFFDQNGKWFGLHYAQGSFGRIEKEEISLEKTSFRDAKGRLHTPCSFVSKDMDETPLTLEFETIGGCIYAPDALYLHAPNLQHLQGDLTISHSKDFCLPKLRYVGGNLIIRNIKKFSAPLLNHVGGGLFADNAQEFFAPRLRSVGHKLIIPSFRSLKSEQLRNIHRSTESEQSKEDLEKELEKRKEIEDFIAKTQASGLELSL